MVPRALIFAFLFIAAASADFGITGIYEDLPLDSTTTTLPIDGSGDNGFASGSDAIAIDTDCSTREDGLYEIAACSPQFLTCSGGIARIMDCPADLIYDSRIVACEYPLAIPACGGVPADVPETTEEPETTTVGEITIAPSEETPVEVTTVEEASGEPVTRAAADRTCTVDGFFSYGECSDYYYACTNGYSIQMQCPASLAFDEARQLCDYPMAVPECQGNEGSGETTTAEASGELPYDENAYAEETSTTEEPTTTEIVASDEPSTTTEEATTTYGPDSYEETSSTEATTTTDATYVADAYQETSSSEPTEVSTSQDYETSSERAACVGGPTQTGPCSENYTNCVDGQETTFTCNQGLFFSQAQESCVTRDQIAACQTEEPY